MADAAKVTAEDVRRVAELANLELSADEEIRMQRDLNAILGHVAQLNELDTSHVEAMAQVTEILALPPLPALETLRADTVRPSLDRKVVLDSAPETDGVFFKVPKVLER
jgi:aspartyl-tRNA(Asn)/glutamyl-tRNA(Gln) amidotransferase subunit C